MFAKSLVKSIDETAAREPESLNNTLTVDKVAEGSLAEFSGVITGDILLTVNGHAANLVDICQLIIESETVNYCFYSPSKGMLRTLVTQAAPLGVETSKSRQTVLSEYAQNPKHADHTDLYPVWNQADSEALKQITLRAIKPWKMSMLRFMNSMVYSPEYLFYGAALYDLGEREKGMKIIRDFEDCRPESHTQEQDAVVIYYYARELLFQDRKKEAIDKMLEAFSCWHHPRIQQEIYDLTGDWYEFRRYWPGREFPCDYTLSQVEFGSGKVSFSDALGQMQDRQLLVICMLGSYRVNRFYNAFMQRWLSYKQTFGDFIYDLHVITSNPQQENHPDYFYFEKQFVKHAGPIKLLSDPQWQVWENLEPHGSPTIYVVNNQGEILYEGDLSDFDMWQLVSGIEKN